MQIYKCDRCGAVMTDPTVSKPICKPLRDGEEGDVYIGAYTLKKVDLCPTCYQTFTDWWDERVNAVSVDPVE